LGPGISRWAAESIDSETDLSLNVGTGARWFLSDNFGLRFDAKLRYTPSALEGTTAALGESFPGESITAWSIGGGVSIRIGGVKDSDHDGVVNPLDSCPDTLDGVRVDGSGCPLGSDGDRVADHVDDCPDTPRGASVDGAGCPSDSDDDAVYDGIDQCANTPRGAQVDAAGCPVDSDRDGVFNGLDSCPNTPRGTEVGARGCPVPQPDPEPAPEPISVENILFEVDSSELDATAQAVLDEAGRLVRERDDVIIELDGHTDSTASDQHNEGLGERRAHAVMDYLAENFGIRRERVVVVTYGEREPAADNDTENGRRLNRRVVIRVRN
jgi:OOP family OmpA-OmpF porin